jgi:hypothetical protein
VEVIDKRRLMSEDADAIKQALTSLLERERDLVEHERSLRAELARVRSAIAALSPLVGLHASVPPHPDVAGRTIPEAAELVIREAAAPLHPEEIQKKLSERGYQVSMASLVGALARKARQRQTFRRTGRGRYGLIAPDVPQSGDPAQMALSVVADIKPTEAILQSVQERPGITSVEVASDIASVIRARRDARKIVITLIGQMVKRGKLRRDPDGGLHVNVAPVVDG